VVDRPCLVGLTGGLATGKSTVAVMLGRRGVPVFDADAAVHRLYRAGEPGAEAVAAEFGFQTLDETGSVDRAKLAHRVVGDAEALDRLNRLVHPLVRDAIRRWLADLTPQPMVAVVEAALLVETGSYSDYDALIVVSCEPVEQLRRAVARGMDETRARGLVAAQLDLAAKRAVADLVIENSGSLDELSEAVSAGWLEVKRLCRERCGGDADGP
jgi:dephospho-CoA kinase